MARPEQVNELIRKELADLINKEVAFEGALLTVTFVDCSKDLRDATIGVSVLPSGLTGTALKKLRQNTGLLANALQKRTRLRHIPRFRWEIDATEEKAEGVEALLKKIREGEIE